MIHPGLEIQLFSRDEDLAADLCAYVQTWVKCANILAEDPYITDTKTWSIVYPNGSKVRSWSSAAERAVGKSGVIVLDEFQSMPDAQGLWNYASPTRAWGGSIVCVGTQRPDTLFNTFTVDAEHGNESGWAYHSITIDQCLDDGLLSKVNMRLRALAFPEWKDRAAYKKFLFAGMTPEAVRQEFYHEACIEVYRVFKESVVERQSVDTEQLYILPGRKKGLSYLGFDVGRIHDRSVVCVLELIANQLYVRYLETLEQCTFTTMMAKLTEAVNLWTPEMIVVDASTIGIQLSEDATARWGEMRVIPATIGGLSKEKIICHTQGLLDMGRLWIPRSPAIKSQFMAISKKLTPEGLCRYMLPSSAAGHCDEFMAIALGAYGCSGNPTDVMAQRLQKQDSGAKAQKRVMSHQRAYSHPGEE